jgi:HEPN domain-containing protein
MQPERANEVREWLRKAGNDLRGAQVDMAASPPLKEDALFHCQQACEKSMKALLTANGMAFRRTHDLDELASSCEGIFPDLHATLDPARELTVFAWRFRYPGEPAEPSVDECRSAQAIAQAVYGAILARIPEEAHPFPGLWGT